MTMVNSTISDQMYLFDDNSWVNQLLELTRLENALVTEAESFLKVYHYLKILIVTLGTIGHLLSLTVMFASGSMKSPSFVYHKALTLAELLYCVNVSVETFVDYKYGYNTGYLQLKYSCHSAAVYNFIVAEVISQTTLFFTLYLTLLIAVDRLLALKPNSQLRKQTKVRGFAVISTLLSLMFAVLWNSWPTLVMYSRLQQDKDNFTSKSTAELPRLNLLLLTICSFYNRAIRLSFPVILAIITAMVIFYFLKKQRRMRFVGSLTRLHCRKDKNLFYLLIITVVLTFLQVLPMEAKRVWEMVEPWVDLERVINDDNSTLERKKLSLQYLYYGHIYMTLLGNIGRFVNQSFNFYLYVVFNHAFRMEVTKLTKRLFGIRVHASEFQPVSTQMS